MATPSLAEELASRAAKALGQIPEQDRRDVYVISFYVYDEEDDPRRPTLTVGFNTNDQWRSSTPEASSELEAKWNFAFWIQNAVVTCGGGEDSLVDRWVESTGHWFSDEDEDADFEGCLAMGEEITKLWIKECCRAVQILHSTGVVIDLFGKAVPVLVHELEYYEEIAAQNEAINPEGVCDEFAKWIRDL